ncbi:MAG TPA: cytochrome C [Thermoanaerobaculia bacterium]|nr:cytochrome C [Thermoanaerobaculia bacterium]
MKKFLRALAATVVVFAAALAALVAFFVLRPPKSRPPSPEKIAITPARVERGRYLVLHVTDCLGCHSDHEFDRFGMPVKAGTEGQGGFAFDEKLGVPGVVCAQNITPDPEFGLASWSDGEVLRAMREGVDRNGRALFPMMPYLGYRHLSDEDARAIVAYLRTLPPIHRPVPAKRIHFPLNLLLKSVPRPLDGPVAPVAAADSVAYGKYLTTIAGCLGCHTTEDARHRPIPGMEFAGGNEYRGPWGTNRSANLTPEAHTWMGHATKAEFIGRFKAFVPLAGNSPVAPRGQNTVMGWLAYSGMTPEDLGAIYDYLKTVKPVRHDVVTFPEAPGASRGGPPAAAP